MRNAVLALSILLGSALAAPAQSVEWANKLFDGGATHDFGNVPRGAVLTYRFPMTNIYAVPLEVTNIRVSCGCVTATANPPVLQPREKGHIDIVMDGRRFTGTKSVTIYVSVGPQFVSTASLQVSANSRADVVFNPGEANFGAVSAGGAPTVSLDVEYAGVLDWRITSVENSAPLDGRLEEMYRRPGQVGYRLHFTLKPDAPAGNHRWQVFLKTNDPASPLVPVAVTASIQAALAVVPEKVRFGSVSADEETTQRVLVRAGKPFRILAVDGLADGLTVDLPSGSSSVQVVTVKWKPGQLRDLKRELRFKTDLDGGASTTVTVEGTAAAAATPPAVPF